MAQQQNDNLNQMPSNENSFMNDVTGKNYPQNGGNIDPSKVNNLWPINQSQFHQSNQQTNTQNQNKQNKRSWKFYSVNYQGFAIQVK